MKFQLPLLAVENLEISKRFYKELFDQDVALDLGRNVTLSGGFALQQDFAWLINVPRDSVVKKSHNMELYFEVEEFDCFLERLGKYENVKFVHPPKKYEWQQRVVRIYDPDYHIIEIGESMATVAKHLLAEGFSLEKVAEIIQHPVEFVQSCIDAK